MLGYFVLGVFIGWAISTYITLVVIRNKRMRRAQAQMAMMNFLGKWVKS